MTSGETKLSFKVRKACINDLNSIKKLVDANKHELGFVTRPALIESIERKEIYIAIQLEEVIGVIHYRHRRDGQTTLYHLVVKVESRQVGVGKRLVSAMQRDARKIGQIFILLKCPVDLSANQFYAKCKFELTATEKGKSRFLNTWQKSLNKTP